MPVYQVPSPEDEARRMCIENLALAATIPSLVGFFVGSPREGFWRVPDWATVYFPAVLAVLGGWVFAKAAGREQRYMGAGALILGVLGYLLRMHVWLGR